MEKNSKKYNIGLDIGTNSVGWAVVDENNEILKFKKKHMWGSRLFKDANTAQVRRTYRSNRRRMSRRKERIKLLRNIFSEEISKIDPQFYLRLDESMRWQEDRKLKNKFNIFDSKEYSDKDYYKEYPTIYHLRKKLVTSDEKEDIRLVYLAMHHIIKYRGNFLYNGELSDSTEYVKDSFTNSLKYLNDTFEMDLSENTIDDIIIKSLLILKDNKKYKSVKQSEITELFGKQSKDNITIIKHFTKLITGSKGKILSKVFELEEEKDFTFDSEIDDSIYELLGEKVEQFNDMQNIYSWVVLQEIMNTNYLTEKQMKEPNKTISYSYISSYNKYQKDLKHLKKIYKKYHEEKYYEMFKSKEINKPTYYNYSLAEEKCKAGNQKKGAEALYATISTDFKKEIEECTKNKKEGLGYDKDIDILANEILNKGFLVKQNIRANGSVPHQLHNEELKRIIKNQSKYYDFLKKDEDKILSIMSFRIPYYVGPLKNIKDAPFAWSIRKEGKECEKITPWNFEQIIDRKESANKFIIRMINQCTYLSQYKVLPKNSLVYSRYCLLNELNNLIVIVKENGKEKVRTIDKNTKALIINKLFIKEKSRTVKEKKLKEFLEQNMLFENILRIDGFAKEGEFASNLTSYIDFCDILECEELSEKQKEMAEKIINWITVFEDKEILKEKIEDEYSNQLTPHQIKRICEKIKYTGWGRLSKELLVNVKTNYKGQKYSIMDLLENTNKNFMQIINDKDYEFIKIIEDAIPKIENKVISEQFYEDNVKPLACSPKVKKGIWQALLVVDEIVKIMKTNPDNIYIEFARDDEESKRTKSRYKKIKEGLSKLNDVSAILSHLKNDEDKKVDLDEKRLLYYIQNGRCMYSGEPLEFDKLYAYEVDHILPQCYIKDNSIENKVLVKRIENQRKEDNLLLNESIINARISEWKKLFDAGLIGNKKFANLTRTKISEESFVNRQLVETRQIIKHVAKILNNIYEETKVNSIKARLSSEFREKFNFIKNREVNDYHHAQDAYIACVIGEFIKHRFPDWGKKELDINEYQKVFRSNKEKYKKMHGRNMQSFIIEEMTRENLVDEDSVLYWEKNRSLGIIDRNLNLFDCYVTKKLEENTSEFYNQNASTKEEAKLMGNPIRIKSNMAPLKYGAYTQKVNAYSVIFSYINAKGKKEYQLEGIPEYETSRVKNNSDIKNYFESLKDDKGNYKYKNVVILKNKILKNQVILKDNMMYSIVSDGEITMNKQLVLDKRIIVLLDMAKKYTEYSSIKDENIETYYYKILKRYTEMKYNDILKEMEIFKDKVLREKRELIEKYVGISDEQLIEIYDILSQKFLNQYDEKIGKTLKELSENYIKIEKIDKIKFINILLKLSSGIAADFKLIGGKSGQGRESKKNMNTKFLEATTFIDQSVTGMFEKRYKVDELENYSNK